MKDDVPSFIEEIEEDEDKTDVTKQYEGAVELFLTLSENRTVPIPMDYAVVYREEDTGKIVFRFVVDVNDEVLDQHYGFEVVSDPGVAEALSSDDDASGETKEKVEVVLDQYSRQLRAVREAIWQNVVNTNERT